MATTPGIQTSTEDAEEDSGPTVAELTLIIFKLTIGILGTLGNLFVCIFVGKMKSQKVKFLIRSQAMIDLGASILITIDTINTELNVEPDPPNIPVIGQLYCNLWSYQLLLFGLFAASSYNLVAISIERYITVFHPFWYRINFTGKKSVLLGVAAWVLGPVAQSVYSFKHGRHIEGKCKWLFSTPNGRKAFAMFLFLWDYFIPCIIMAYCFTRISFKLRQYDSSESGLNKYAGTAAGSESAGVSSRTVSYKLQSSNGVEKEATSATESAAVVDQPQDQKEKKKTSEPQMTAAEKSRSKKVTQTFIVVFLAYLCCWSTNQILFLQYNMGGYRHFGKPEYHFANSMAILNSACNPFIYVLHLKQYRNELKSFFRK